MKKRLSKARPAARSARRKGIVDPAKQARLVSDRLAPAIPSPRIELDFQTPWQLLIATILSAQSTDDRINMVTPMLFRRWPTPRALAAASQAEVEEVVKSTGFFRNKAKAIRECSRALVERHGGEVPRTMEEMVELPGVARKTANVVLGNALGIQAGMAVDTHALRVSRRLALTRQEDPAKVEADLCAVFPKNEWTVSALRLQLHGRYVCTARKPDCAHCPLNEICPSREAVPVGTLQDRIRYERVVVKSRGRERPES